jgi:hypothetical protein
MHMYSRGIDGLVFDNEYACEINAGVLGTF